MNVCSSLSGNINPVFIPSQCQDAFVSVILSFQIIVGNSIKSCQSLPNWCWEDDEVKRSTPFAKVTPITFDNPVIIFTSLICSSSPKHLH